MAPGWMRTPSKLRLELVSEKEFLRKLYCADSAVEATEIIKLGTEKELDILLKILYCLSTGTIPIKKEPFNAVRGHKCLNYMTKNFGRKKSALKFINAAREDKIQALLKLSQVFPHLLDSLFVL